jgi:hypothetical protein
MCLMAQSSIMCVIEDGFKIVVGVFVADDEENYLDNYPEELQAPAEK